MKVPLTRNADWEFWGLLSADRHIDNPKSNLELQLEHLAEAREKGAVVLDFGDLFCMMQGKYDPRSSKSSVRPEHNVNDYLDSVIEWTADKLKPYVKNFAVIGEGNHETAIQKRHETNPTERLCAILNNGSAHRVYNGGYSGFVRFQFEAESRFCRNVTLAYHHGAGGAAPVTANMNAMYHNSGYYPDADIIATGHNHHTWIREVSRMRLTDAGRKFYDQQYLVKLPTYKNGVGDSWGGFEVEKDMKARPIGAWWIRFYWHRPTASVRFDFTRAR